MADALVFSDGPTCWLVELASPSGDKVGWIEERNDGRFHVTAGFDDGLSDSSPLWGVDHGPHDSLDDAMAAIAYRLGGTCRQQQR